MKSILKISLLTLLVSCSGVGETNEIEKVQVKKPYQDQNIVVTSFAKKGSFYREIESNGSLEAKEKAVLNYKLTEDILSVNVSDGQSVKKGQILSVLDSSKQHFNYQKTSRVLNKSRLSLEESLINMGYVLADSANVPENIMKVALLRSGYLDNISDKKLAKIELEKTKIKAPFSGVVANIEAKAHNNSSQYKSFCTLIDNSTFNVKFPVLESEAFKLKKGMDVSVIPYAFEQDTIKGRLVGINPMVEENGMVMATAQIKNTTKRLNEGMNVKVVVREEIKNKLVIPKSAVTLRQERNVVFVCKRDTAYWRYVNVIEENSINCIIKSKKLKEGDEIVVDGNFNLSHLSPIVRMNN